MPAFLELTGGSLWDLIGQSMNGLDLPPTQTGPDAWLGPEMARHKGWILELSLAEVAEFPRPAAAPHLAPYGMPNEAAADALASLDSASFPLPSLGPRLS